jgi:hypothetical protein
LVISFGKRKESKAMNRFNKFLEDLSKNPMLLILWILILIVASFGVYKLIRFIIDKISEYNATSGFNVQKENLTFSISEYNSMANQLFNAMDGAGTNEDIIFSVFNKIQTKDDYNQLIKSFGVRSSTGILSSFSGDLLTWLSDELSSSDVKKLNNILSKIGVSL